MAGKNKLSKKELANLQEIVGNLTGINQQRANICLKKELAIRQIEAEFNENWEVLDLQAQHAQREQNDYMAELSLKYGKNKIFDLDTGNIKDQ